MEEYAVIFEHVSKIYNLKSKDKKQKGKRFYALKDINFKIPKGEVVGILGTNGSGKSTMSIILSGITEPEEGKITVNGEQALIAINTGLNQQLTGYENIQLKGALLGLKKKQVQKIVDEVIEFAELGDFLYQPVKKYSSGMKSRLGFSINLALDPDIFVVDEALSVGDKRFSKKCIDRMTELKNQGKTIIFISHSLPQVTSFCDTAIWLEGGILREYGDIHTVASHYDAYTQELNAMTKKQQKKMLNEKFEERIIHERQKVSLLNRLFE